MTKHWFITGTSRGFGREWAIAALARAHDVFGRLDIVINNAG